MKTLLTATAAIALLAGVGAASAQMYQPVPPPLAPDSATQPYLGYQVMQAPVQPMQQPSYTSGAMATPTWMMDDGSSSDHPIHNLGDRSGDALNAQYQGGLTTAPGTGLPAYPGQ
jgi:hypothetical protein